MNVSKPLHVSFALATAGIVALSGCSATETGSAASNSATGAATASESNSARLTVNKAWVKAAEGGMTAVFGEITNTTDTAVTITAASSNASNTENTQLHTTEIDPTTGTSAMKQAESFTIEPGQTLKLEPGGNHIMLMNLTCSLPAGTVARVSLSTDSGQSIDFEAEARDYSGAQEEYAPGEEGSASATSDQEHSTTDHSEHSEMQTASGQALEQCA